VSPRSPLPLAIALAGVALVVSGCESTQDKSARIAAELGPVAKEEGLRITKRSKDVRVVSTALLTEPEASAVVVRVHNDSDRDLVNVPIAIDVLDAKGRSVYRNDIPGIEPALAAVPFVAAGDDAYWVNDQILATGEPASVKATVGAGGQPFSGEPPKISVSKPELEGDPYSGLLVGGNVVNESGDEQGRLLLYAIARRGDKVLAAGRGAIEKLKAEPKPLPYNVYLVGDPQGAETTITQFPTLPGFEEE
jgi:hypothetical protein